MICVRHFALAEGGQGLNFVTAVAAALVAGLTIARLALALGAHGALRRLVVARHRIHQVVREAGQRVILLSEARRNLCMNLLPVSEEFLVQGLLLARHAYPDKGAAACSRFDNAHVARLQILGRVGRADAVGALRRGLASNAAGHIVWHGCGTLDAIIVIIVRITVGLCGVGFSAREHQLELELFAQ